MDETAENTNKAGFRAGDRLLCVAVDPRFSGLDKGARYTVRRADEMYVVLEEFDHPNGWANYHFVLPPPPANPV